MDINFLSFKKGGSVYLDILGKIRNTKLPFSKPLLPLFDAIVNAIDAIEETGRDDGNIEVRIIRDNSQVGLYDSQNSHDNQNPIVSFEVFDNGIGFNEEHFRHFQTSDTTFKLQKGGKGIGRFLWLKAFERVRVESIYYDSGLCFVRKFLFEPVGDGITNHSLEQIPASDASTKVALIGLRTDYRKNCPCAAEIIGRQIIQHCMSYFLWPKCPNILLVDGNDKILLNKIFHDQISSTSNCRNFSVKGRDFKALYLRLYSDVKQHRIHYCANNREVYNDNITVFIPDLQKSLVDENKRQFYYATYISSEFLDERVNNERTSFDLVDDNDNLFPDEITKEDLHNAVMSEVKSFLQSYLREIETHKMERIRNYIYGQAPRYRVLLKYGEKYLRNISAYGSDQALDNELYRAWSQMKADLKERGDALLGKKIEITDINEYKKQFNDYANQLNDFVKSELAEYIVHRKVVLDLLQKSLEFKSDGRYHWEEALHQIIFPMQKTSDDIDYERQNLWVIDEKLSYHRYLASDLPLSSIDMLKVSSRERPDLIIFNSPFAFVEDNPPFSSVVVIDFKRPLRNDYSDDKNPINQVYGYVKKIRSGKVKDKKGRPILLAQNTPFYCYVLCDLTEKIREQAGNADLRPMPDGLGFFGYNITHGCYIEVISYEKLIEDARKRNQILFDKLYLPKKEISLRELS
ncbi:MAG TPA: ATP-binding protein [Bacillota bacterium]|nr:ATP-binding protein [Bacillota bacterium]